MLQAILLNSQRPTNVRRWMPVCVCVCPTSPRQSSFAPSGSEPACCPAAALACHSLSALPACPPAGHGESPRPVPLLDIFRESEKAIQRQKKVTVNHKQNFNGCNRESIGALPLHASDIVNSIAMNRKVCS